MNDGQQSNSAGNNEGRADCHNSQGGAEIVHASNGSGTPIKSMDDGEQQPEEGNEQQGTIGPNTSMTYSRSAPLPNCHRIRGLRARIARFGKPHHDDGREIVEH